MKFRNIIDVRKLMRGAVFALGFSLMLSNSMNTKAYASTGFVENAYSQGTPYGFTWTNTNGLSLDATSHTQGMFDFNYNFTSGSDWNISLGKPTTYSGWVNIDVFNANVRADKNVSLTPPGYGIFSGEFMTDPTNVFFSQPPDANYLYVNVTQSPNGLWLYDTLGQGANSQQNTLGQQSHFETQQTSGTGGFLAPTSVE